MLWDASRQQERDGSTGRRCVLRCHLLRPVTVLLCIPVLSVRSTRSSFRPSRLSHQVTDDERRANSAEAKVAAVSTCLFGRTYKDTGKLPTIASPPYARVVSTFNSSNDDDATSHRTCPGVPASTGYSESPLW